MPNSHSGEHKRVLHIISGDLWAGAEAQACTLLKFLRPLCEVHAVLLNHGELERRLRALDIPVTVIDESELSAWAIFIGIRKAIKSISPAVIHTHRQKENILGAFANFTTIHTRCIRTQHGAPEFQGNWKTTILRKVDQWVGNTLQDKIIAVSEDLKAKLLSQHPSNKIVVISNGVDAGELKSKASTTEFRQQQPDKKHIGIIGRLVPVKRVDRFLEAAAFFKKENRTDYHFHVIGDGPLKKELIEYSDNQNLQDLVTFHGHRDDIPSYINSLDAVVMCSDHEGMPMVALETIALGTPLLSTLKGLVETLLLPLPPNFTIPELIDNLPIKNGSIGKFVPAKECAENTFRLYSPILTNS